MNAVSFKWSLKRWLNLVNLQLGLLIRFQFGDAAPWSTGHTKRLFLPIMELCQRFLLCLCALFPLLAIAHTAVNLAEPQADPESQGRLHRSIIRDRFSALNFPELISKTINKWTMDVLPHTHRKDLIQKAKDYYKKEWSGWYKHYFSNFGAPKYQQKLFEH